MREIRAPHSLPERADLFLAGGISGADDWQPRALDLLASTPGLVFNPRRREVMKPEWEQQQIEWEYEALRRSRAIVFWFPPQTLCPITLYELGAWAMTEVPLFVGVDPGYQRRRDVFHQLRLQRPEIIVHSTLNATVENYLA